MPAIATMTAALHAHNFTDQPVIANDGAILRFHDLSFLVELNSVDNGMELASLLTSGEQVKFGEHLVERAIGEVEVWSDPGIAGVEEVMDELETLLDPVFTSSFAERKSIACACGCLSAVTNDV